jgi:hypothetical protein
MATLFIQRATPFKRGSQSVQILVDGKSVCTLWNAEPKTVEVAAGQHTLQASMGGINGDPITIVARHGQTRRVNLLPGEFKAEHPGLFLASVLICLIPDPFLFGAFYWIRIVLFVAIIAYIIYMAKKNRKGQLVLIDQGEISKASLPKLTGGRVQQEVLL